MHVRIVQHEGKIRKIGSILKESELLSIYLSIKLFFELLDSAVAIAKVVAFFSLVKAVTIAKAVAFLSLVKVLTCYYQAKAVQQH